MTTALAAIGRGAPVDLVFQSVAGSKAANRNFGIDLGLLRQAQHGALSLGQWTLGHNVMFVETGQGERPFPPKPTESTSRRWRRAPAVARNYLRRVLNKRPAPEFAEWLERMGFADSSGQLIEPPSANRLPMSMRPVLALLAQLR